MIEKARLLAHNLLAEAEKNEPQITADIKQMVSEISAETVGLENKFKTKKSLTRKILNTATLNSEPLEQVAESINDALRYTFVLPAESYARKFRQTIGKLKESGYRIPKERIWNAWRTAGKSFDKGYRGINVTVISSQSQLFELQFHTAESYKLKTQTHFQYKLLKNKKISEKRQSEIIETLRKQAENVKRPEGV